MSFAYHADGRIHRQVTPKGDFVFESVGEYQPKGISRKVQAYRVLGRRELADTASNRAAH